MTTGTSSGNSSRTERSVEQVEDSVGRMGNSMAKVSSGQHTPNKLAGHQMMYIGASSGNTRQNIWLVTEYSWEYWARKYWEGAKRKPEDFHGMLCQFFQATSCLCVLFLKGDL